MHCGYTFRTLSLIYVLRDLAGIQACKIMQESRERTRVLLVTETDFRSGTIEQIVSGFQQRRGASVAVEVELIDCIPVEKSGRFRYIISHA